MPPSSARNLLCRDKHLVLVDLRDAQVRHDDVKKLHNEPVRLSYSRNLCEQGNFTNYLLRRVVIEKDILDMLDGNDAIGPPTPGFIDIAEGSASNRLNVLVLVMQEFPRDGHVDLIGTSWEHY